MVKLMFYVKVNLFTLLSMNGNQILAIKIFVFNLYRCISLHLIPTHFTCMIKRDYHKTNKRNKEYNPAMPFYGFNFSFPSKKRREKKAPTAPATNAYSIGI